MVSFLVDVSCVCAMGEGRRMRSPAEKGRVEFDLGAARRAAHVAKQGRVFKGRRILRVNRLINFNINGGISIITMRG